MDSMRNPTRRCAALPLVILTFCAGGSACGSSSGGSATQSGDDGGMGASDAAPDVPDGEGAAGDAPTDATGGSDSPSPGDGSPGSEGGHPQPGAWVMGYYASWHSPANGGDYAVSSIDWDGLTHVAAAFYIPDATGGWASGSFDQTTAAALITAAHAQGKKVLASIGGSASGPGFEQAMQNAQSTFVANLEALVTSGYDGLDIDWEGGNLSAAQDQTLQTTLVQALRQKSPGILITLTAGTENENSLDDLSWYGTVAAQLDRINLMTYGMAGAWQGWRSWHSSPLHWNNDSTTPAGIDASVAHYIAAGVPAAKLGIGIGFYGMCYTAPVTAPVQTLGASQVSASDGVMSYPNIVGTYYSANAYHYDSAADAPYLTLDGNNAQKCTYVSYEDPTSIAAKGAWLKAQGLGAVILWEIGEGFVPSGATVQAQNPLLEATKTAFLQ
jgi:chitinase